MNLSTVTHVLAAAACALFLGCGGSETKTPAKKASDSPQQSTKTESKPVTEQPTGGPTKVSGDTVTTASGLQYLMIKEGSGEMPKVGEIVTVHASGWFTDGKKFWSSHDDGNPLVFALGATPPKVIAGWEEGLLLMKAGEKRQLIIPAKLAYGENGRPGAIPPNATLIFDVELVGIKK
ncbi:FKBP-type peptidyl-prolyl cis-trans isomerase [bacterium]|nr:FKBP-type peptidyl-prolyl cis-trans isomerase [bacterium]